MGVIPIKRRERTLLGLGRVAAAVVLTLTALAWVGWATGIQALTRVYPAWPPMKPWTAVWLAALAVAILVQSGGPSPARIWIGRGLAAVAGVTTVLILAEYATGRSFGLDSFWFGEAVRRVQPILPGRPSPQTVSSALLLSIPIALTPANRPSTRMAGAACLLAATVMPFFTIVAYLFGAVARLQIADSTGMALTTALSLLLLGAAMVLLQPAWLLVRSDRLSLIRLGTILAGFPLIVGLSRRAFLAFGLRDDLALTIATATATVVLGTAAYRLSRREHALHEASESDRTQLESTRGLLAASADSMLDPQVLLEAVRDPAGQVIDFRYLSVNAATCSYLGLQENDLVGHTQLEASPNLKGSELHQRYVRCLEDGEPVIIDDYSFFNEIIDDERRYDIRATRAGADLLSLTWSDVTERFDAAQRVRVAQTLLRSTVDSMLDPQMLLEGVRDPAGRVVDFIYREANAAACQDMAMTRDELVGRTVLELLPGFAESGPLPYYAQCLETGQPGALDDYSYDNEIHADSRRYDIRIAPAGKDLISLTFRDVTDRFQSAQRALAAQTLLHATVDSMLNPQMLLEAVRNRTGQVVDFVYRSANRAFCSYRGWEERDIIGGSLLEAQPRLRSLGLFERYINCADTGESLILDDFEMFNAMIGETRRYDIRVLRAGVDLISLTFSDVTERYHAAARIAASEHDYRLLAENAGDLVVLIRDGRFVWVSPSCTNVIGESPDYWVGREATEIVLPEESELITNSTEVVESGGVVQVRHRVQAFDGTIHWVDVHAKPFYAPDGREDGLTAAMRVIDDEVAAEQRAEEARRLQARADALYRRSVDSAAVGMCLINPEGGFVDVNDAVCEFFGYDADTLKSKNWQELTAEADTRADMDNVADVMAGRIESYRVTKQYVHADGHPIWGDASVGCVRDRDGHVEVLIVQINDITAEVEARQELLISEERNRELAQGLQAELSSAARYLQSVLPADMTGQVSVSSAYRPSNTLGGDSFDFYWLDDDHMVVYLLDVSGHGVESALIAVSVHNMLRSASFTTETMLEPDRVLAALNQQFGMDQHDDNYFTIFYGVYQRSSATLRYTNAGHPPALIFTGGQMTELSSQSFPVGMFGDTPFTTAAVQIPPGSQMLLYSDGVYELPLADGGQWPMEDFVNLCTRIAGSPDWSLDDLVDSAQRHSAVGSFNDDCTLVRLTFDCDLAVADRRVSDAAGHS